MTVTPLVNLTPGLYGPGGPVTIPGQSYGPTVPVYGITPVTQPPSSGGGGSSGGSSQSSQPSASPSGGGGSSGGGATTPIIRTTNTLEEDLKVVGLTDEGLTQEQIGALTYAGYNITTDTNTNMVNIVDPRVASRNTSNNITPFSPFYNPDFQQDILIQQEAQQVKGPYTEQGAKQKATRDLIFQGKLPEGTKGVYTPQGKQEIITEYMKTTEFKQYAETPIGRSQLTAIGQSQAEKQVTTPDTYKFSVPFIGTVDTGIKQPEWTAQLNISTVSVIDTEASKRTLAENMLFREGNVYQDLGFRTRISQSFGEAGLRAVLWPITLPQTIIKLGTGGKTLFLPDVSNIIGERQVAPTQGYIEGFIGEGLTLGKSDFSENIKKYPIETMFAGAGEISGLVTGGKAVQITKATAYKGMGYARTGINTATGLNLPGYEQMSFYFPQRIIRRAWVKAGTKDIDTAIGTPYHSAETLTPTGLSFAVGKTPAQKIAWTVSKAEESRTLPYSEGDIMLGSSGTSRIGRSFIVKTKVTHELPSISTAPYGYTPTRFYRFGSPDVNYSGSISLLPKLNTPTGLITRIKRLYAPPKGSYEDVGAWAKPQPKGDWGVVGLKMYLGGPEAEINIFGKTKLMRYLPDRPSFFQRIKGYQYYAKVPLESGKTEVVPAVFTKSVHKGFPSGAKLLLESKPVQGIKEFVYPSSSGKATSSVVSAGSLAGITTRSSYTKSSFKPSIPSYVSKPSVPSRGSYPSRASGSSLPSAPSVPSSPSIVSRPGYSPPSSPPSYPKSPPYSPPSSPPSYPKSPPSPPSYNPPSEPPYYPYYGRKRKTPIYTGENKAYLDFDRSFRKRSFPVYVPFQNIKINTKIPGV